MNKLYTWATALISATCLTVVTTVAVNNDTFNNIKVAQGVGTSTTYSTSLVMRTSYNNDLKYFSYNESTKIGEVSNSSVEYTLSWVNGNSNEFSIYTGSTYLDIDTKSNKFINSETPVYWSIDENGIGRTVNETTKYLYYNSTSPRCVPYKLSSVTAAYSQIFFYTDTQLEAWKTHCTGTFAEACLTNIAYSIPTVTLYTISFNANGGTETMNPVQVQEGSSYTLPSCDFTAPSGKIFDGWAYSANGEKITTKSITINNDITLYALWKDEVINPNPIIFADLGLSNGVQYLDPFQGNGFTVTFAGGNNDGKYYTTGSGIRVYGNGTMTIASSTNMKTIIITYDGSNKPSTSDVVNVGTYDTSTGTWTGNAQNVVFTRPSGSGHWRVKSVEVIF